MPTEQDEQDEEEKLPEKPALTGNQWEKLEMNLCRVTSYIATMFLTLWYTSWAISGNL